MSKLFIPKDYSSKLDLYRTQRAISYIKQHFQEGLAEALNLKRVSAPLFVTEASGLNDNLNGTERPVSFDIPDAGEIGQVVHSLAKWKRLALKEYGFYVGYGLYTDMNAIRRDEELDNIHSIYVDQWDWEKVITKEDRTLDYLIEVSQKIVDVICDTHEYILEHFPELDTEISRKMVAVTTQELEDMYPNMTSKEREDAFLREHKTALIMQIGGKLKSGKPHDGRAPDYDDWALRSAEFVIQTGTGEHYHRCGDAEQCELRREIVLKQLLDALDSLFRVFYASEEIGIIIWNCQSHGVFCLC